MAVRPPTITKPRQGEVVAAGPVEVVGRISKAVPNSRVMINGRSVPLAGRTFRTTVNANTDGDFEIIARHEGERMVPVQRAVFVVVDATPPTIEISSPSPSTYEVQATRIAIRGRARDTALKDVWLEVRGRRQRIRFDRRTGRFTTGVSLRPYVETRIRVVAVDRVGLEGSDELVIFSNPPRPEVPPPMPTPTPTPEPGMGDDGVMAAQIRVRRIQIFRLNPGIVLDDVTNGLEGGGPRWIPVRQGTHRMRGGRYRIVISGTVTGARPTDVLMNQGQRLAFRGGSFTAEEQYTDNLRLAAGMPRPPLNDGIFRLALVDRNGARRAQMNLPRPNIAIPRAPKPPPGRTQPGESCGGGGGGESCGGGGSGCGGGR